jgi:hypothetical protein
MDLIHDKAKFLAGELFIKNPAAQDIMYSVDRENQSFNAVCFGEIANRTSPLTQSVAYYIVYELEQRCKRKEKRAIIHWPANHGFARSYACFKRQNFLENDGY